MPQKSGLLGNEMDLMPDIAFKCMSAIFRIRDLFLDFNKQLTPFQIKMGQTVIDYGCGTGSYLKRASILVGEHGTVYAMDIHPLSIERVKKRIQKENLKNITPILVKDYSCLVEDNTADVIYALDMFHMVKYPDRFLKELNRLLKAGGRLFLEDGHQSREKTKAKILKTGLWEIISEEKRHVACIPLKQPNP